MVANGDSSDSQLKKCPYCAELIQKDAILCKHCGRDLRVDPNASAAHKQWTPSWLLIGLLAVVAVCAVCGGLWFMGVLAAPTPAAGAVNASLVPKIHTVAYEVVELTHSDVFVSGVDVTLQNPQGGTEQGHYGFPFKEGFNFSDGQFAYISAQKDEVGGSFSCHIWVDGVLWRSSTSTGPYSIATCSGTIGQP